MDDLIVSIIAVALTAIGAGAAFTMMEVRGGSKEPGRNKKLIARHKILGYLFVSFFLVISAGMIYKVGLHSGELSTRILLHGVLGLFVIGLLAVKLMIARKYRKLSENLFGFGVVILAMTFVMMSVAAGYFFLHITQEMHEEHASKAAAASHPDDLKGRLLLENKCTKCHGLEKVFAEHMDKNEWDKTLTRMVAHSGDPNYLSEEERAGIIMYLSTLGE